MLAIILTIMVLEMKVPKGADFYGGVLLMAATAWWILARALIREEGAHSLLGIAIGKDFKGKLSILLYALAISLSFVNQWVAQGLYLAVAMMWLVPDRRIERLVIPRE